MADRIAELSLSAAEAPLAAPIADATHRLEAIRFLVVRLTLASGIVGEGYLLAFHYNPNAIVGALRDLAPLVVGTPFDPPGVLRRRWQAESEYFGSEGLNRWALGVVDLALWDAWGRTLGQPLWRVFGRTHERVPAYGSGGWLSYRDEELVAEAQRYAARGFRAVKVKVGSPEPGRDLERLRRVRAAVGPDIGIMMDANQGFRYPQASRLAREAAAIGIDWFEEPLPHDDFAGYAALRTACPIALAMGEREYDTTALRELVARRALDLWQPDILRLGGVAGWQRSAAVAQAYGIPVLPHFYKEYDVPLLCGVDLAHGVESFDWVDPLIEGGVRIADGWATPSPEPGWGFRFRDAVLTGIR